MLTADEAIKAWILKRAPADVQEHYASCDTASAYLDIEGYLIEGCPSCGPERGNEVSYGISCNHKKSRAAYWYWSKTDDHSGSFDITTLINEVIEAGNGN